MQNLDRDEVSTFVHATPREVYDVVSDVTRTPEYSPEIRSCRWIDGATGPAVGARFASVNKLERGRAWTNRPVVTVADPGREFAFSRSEKVAGTILWRYRFEPEGDGTRVTESYEVLEPVSRFGWFVIGTLYGRKDRRADLHDGMRQSLARLQSLVEAGRRSPA